MSDTPDVNRRLNELILLVSLITMSTTKSDYWRERINVISSFFSHLSLSLAGQIVSQKIKILPRDPQIIHMSPPEQKVILTFLEVQDIFLMD